MMNVMSVVGLTMRPLRVGNIDKCRLRLSLFARDSLRVGQSQVETVRADLSRRMLPDGPRQNERVAFADEARGDQ